MHRQANHSLIATMSIDALPTELDNRILTFLDHDALNTVSKISNTYGRVAEPYLYRHIKHTTSHEVNMRWLIVTLLHRPELAAHIKTIEFFEDHRTRDGIFIDAQRTVQLSILLEQAVDKLHQTIRNMLGSKADKAELQVSWLGAILADDYVEGSLALIVCLAHNIESLIFIGEVRKGVMTGYQGDLLTTIMWETFNHFYSETSGSIQPATTPRDSRPFGVFTISTSRHSRL